MAAAISINPGYGPMGHSRHRNRIIAIAQLDLDHGDCHWAVAKWSIGIGQPLWRRAMMAAGRRPDAGVPQRPRPAPDFNGLGRGDPYGLHSTASLLSVQRATSLMRSEESAAFGADSV